MDSVNRMTVLTFGASSHSPALFAGAPLGGLMEFAGADDPANEEGGARYCAINVYQVVEDPSSSDMATFANADWFLAIRAMNRGVYYQCGFLKPDGQSAKLGVDGPFCASFYREATGFPARMAGNATISNHLVDSRSGNILLSRHGMDNARTSFQADLNALCDRDDALRPTREQVQDQFSAFVEGSSIEYLYRRCPHVLKFGHPIVNQTETPPTSV